MYRFKWNILILFVVLLLEAQAFAFPPMLSSGSGGVTQDDPLIIALDPDADGDPSDCTAIVAKENVVTAGSLVNSVVLLEDLGNDAKQYITTQATTGVSDVVEITGYFNDYNRYLVVVTSDTDNQALTIYDTDNTPVNGTELVIQNGGSNTLNMTTVAGQQQLFPSYVVIEQGEAVTFIYHTDRWYELARAVANVTFSSIDMGSGTFDLPSQASSDLTLADLGKIGIDDTDDSIAWHDGANGEIAGEVQLSGIIHKAWSFDPKAVCDGAVDRLFLFTVGDEAPNGIIIDEWKVSFEANPTTEADLDLKYADAFIGVANAAVIDVLDTTNGASSEDTDANINGGVAVANTKSVYLEFGTAYTETTHQIIFELWYHSEED